jgi:hypothetical protein
VDRNGIVCAVAFTGYNTTTQLGIGRISSAMRANAGNAFAFDSTSSSNGAGFPRGLALSTANLYSATQPGGFVGELPNNYPVNQSAAFSTRIDLFGAGDDWALERLTPLVYPESRKIAPCKERAEHTLQSTALVHEAYPRLVDARIAQWQDPPIFFAVWAQMMRRIPVSAARRRTAAKRGAGCVTFERKYDAMGECIAAFCVHQAGLP